MPSPILARADALMQRRRQTLAEGEDVPLLTDAIDPEEDIPVLVDIEEPATTTTNIADSPSTPPATAPVAASPANPEPATLAATATVSPPDITALSDELARRVTARLHAELPGIVAEVVRELLAEQAAGTPNRLPR
jgi:hypothetical protein